MANSNEKTIILILLVVIVLFILANIVPAFFLTIGRPGELRFPGFPGFFHFAPLFPLLLLLILWLIVVVWVYRDAERRGMNGVLWALLIFVGNFVALIIYLIVRNDGFSQRVSLEPTQNCKNCGKVVAQKYAFCPHCGTQIKTVCTSCSKPVANDWKVCPYCGQKLKD
ncbi:MAG: zinc ribbon domain-containing protein [bacterium]|jgi:RNA polymerase subunit RPABC4/transcription elongation factor Spt4|nr:zinc ribbon domain-containing protein [bacterium]